MKYLSILLFPTIALGATMSVSSLLPFEGQASGTVVTSSIITTGLQGQSLGTWVTTNDPDSQVAGATPNLAIQTAASNNFPGIITVNGTIYSTAGSTGMRATMDTDGAVQLNLSQGYMLSVGFFFRFHGALINYSPRDLVSLRSDPTGNYQFLQMYDGPTPYFHAHWQPYSGGNGNGNDVSFQRDKWYWITMNHVGGGGTFRIQMYDPSTYPYTLVGESTGVVSSGTTGCTTIQFGILKYSSGGTQWVDYDNFSIDTTGTFPLLPTNDQIHKWSGIITDDTRAIDWEASGIPGGIPTNRTQCGSTLAAATYANGTSDATSGIQAALNACGTSEYVLLGPGIFRINTSLIVPSNVTLRGSGAGTTILKTYGSDYGAINLGNGSAPNTTDSTAISSGGTKGSAIIVVASATGIAVGTMLQITELNDASYVSSTANNGACPWCDQWSGTRSKGQIVMATSVAGTTVGISPPLYSNYTLTPLATPFSAAAEYAGVENLQIYATNSGYTASINTVATRYCWVKGVESNFADGDHLQAYYSYRGEVRDSYFHDSWTHVSGTVEGALSISRKSSAWLITNNILQRQHVPVLLEWGSAGNVVAYNYVFGAYATGADNVMNGDLQTHGAHPQYNLFEGNVATELHQDASWGTSSHSTAFRNWLQGTTQICLPYDSRGDLGACHWAYQASRAVQLDYTTSYNNLLGNVVGSNEQESLVDNNGIALGHTSSVVATADRSYDTVTFNYTWDYDNLADTGGAENTPGQAYATRYIHGDYGRTANAITWDAGNANHTLPASLHLSAKPSWWGSLPWPSIGPDVSGGTGPGGYTSATAANPAMAYFLAATKDSTGSIATFEPNTYYGIGTAPTITTTTLPGGTVGTAYSQTLSADGDTPITWNLTVGTLTACGLSLNSGTGAITGTPSSTASCPITVQASNATGTDSRDLSVTIAAAPVSTPLTLFGGKVTAGGNIKAH